MAWIKTDDSSYVNLATATAVKKTGDDTWIVRDGGGEWFSLTLPDDDLRTLLDDEPTQIELIAHSLNALAEDIESLIDIIDKAVPLDKNGQMRGLRIRNVGL